jgi:transcriptional regulator with XRE-family HTH domain
MEKLQIGEVIFRLRKEKGITQDQLGSFIGVSTAAVSKWESGNSYPDITLLPVLATFFNVSIDKLLNYKIELSEDEGKEIFTECEAMFSSGDLEKAIEKSKEYIVKYPQSYYLKYMLGSLFNMYSWKTDNKEKSKEMEAYCAQMLEDVAQNCSEVKLVEQALYELSAHYLEIGEEDKAIEVLNKIHKSELHINIMLAHAYVKKNEIKKAREIYQRELLKQLNYMSLACSSLAGTYGKVEKDLNMVEKYYNLIISIKKAFSSKEDSILGLNNEYLYYTRAYLKFDEQEKAISMLKKMMKYVKNNDMNKPIKFNSIWCFNELSDGNSGITVSLYEVLFKILEEPLFDLIRERDEFKDIVKDIRHMKER